MSFRALVVRVVVLASGLLLEPAAAAAAPGRGPDQHSSDGRPGQVLDPARPPGERAVARTASRRWVVAPGVAYREWTAALPQGAVRMHLLRVETSRRDLSLDLAAAGATTRRVPVSRLVRARRAVAGVNASFFDLDRTGAALGVGRERARGLLHGPRSAWRPCLRVDAQGNPRIGRARVAGAVTHRGRRVVALDGLNSPRVRSDRAVVYTSRWGRRPAEQVLDTAPRAHQVGISRGVVRWTTSRPTSGQRIRGQVLLGSGRAAEALARLRVGDRVRVTTRSTHPDARVEVCGSTRLLGRGRTPRLDQVRLHPRTAVGIDRDSRRLLLLVADGRSPRSSGLTLHQLAEQLRALGADDALNLDGGGSSTLVAADPRGRRAVRNDPSDGRPRRVPNALVVRHGP